MLPIQHRLWDGAPARRCQVNVAKSLALSWPDAGKRFFFFNLLTLLQEYELVFWYILYPATKGGRLSEAEKKELLWPLVPACTTHLINYKDSPTNHGLLCLSVSLSFFFSPPSMNLGVDKIIPMEDPNKGPAWGEITGACVYTHSPGVWGNTLSVADGT